MSLFKKYRYHLSGLDLSAFARHLCVFNRLSRDLSFNPYSCTGSGATLQKIFFKKRRFGPGDYFFLITLEKNCFDFDVRVNHCPLRTKDWIRKTRPSILINGGFFDYHYKPVGLARGGGVLAGTFNPRLQGVLIIKKQSITIDWAVNQTGESLAESDAVLQSGPMIIEPGGIRGIYSDDGKLDRRSVVGVDRNGRLVLAVFPHRSVSLFEVMEILMQLNLKVCMNLDGGTSVSLFFSCNETTLYLPSIKKIPDVIAISMKKNSC